LLAFTVVFLATVAPSQPLATIRLHQRGLSSWGTGIRGLVRGMATLSQGNQELLVVRDKVGRPPGELGVSKTMECDIFPSVL